MRHRFLMNGDPVGTCIRKDGDELVGVLDHQVAVEWQVRDFSDRGHHWRTDRQVGHEVSVHDIEVHQCSASCFCSANLFRQSCEVGGKNGGGKLGQRGFADPGALV